jgi:putative hemolysin
MKIDDTNTLTYPFEKNIGSRELIIDIAKTDELLDQAFRLRYRVFNEELAEGLKSSALTGRDEDSFDRYCDHLVVIDKQSQKVVGTYRLQRFDQAREGIGFYSATEFDLNNLIEADFRLLEIGRACIERDYRDGSVMNALWYGVVRYMRKHQLDYLCGCASLAKAESAEQASLVYAFAKLTGKLADDKFKITPLAKNTVVGFNPNLEIDNPVAVRRQLPPLLRGYFTIDCKIAGYPAYDAEFDVIDFFVVFDFTQISSSPAKRFF